MPLTEQQKQSLEAEAQKRGLDPKALIAEAESLLSESEPNAERKAVADGASSSGEPPKLFMYHLPFVRVREVRRVWLGLEESFPGDEMIAAEWAARFAAGGGGDTPPESA